MKKSNPALTREPMTGAVVRLKPDTTIRDPAFVISQSSNPPIFRFL